MFLEYVGQHNLVDEKTAAQCVTTPNMSHIPWFTGLSSLEAEQYLEGSGQSCPLSAFHNAPFAAGTTTLGIVDRLTARLMH